MAITEVTPWASGDSPYGADLIELTNTGTQVVDLTGYRIDDSSNQFALLPSPLTGVASLAPGASAVFFESSPADLPAKQTQFLTAWLGTTTAPAGLVIGSYSGSGIGLSTGGDAVNLFDTYGRTVAVVSFGSSTVGRTFDNTGAATGVISTLSAARSTPPSPQSTVTASARPATCRGRAPPSTPPGAPSRRAARSTGPSGGPLIEVPGSNPYGAWQEIATAADGTAVWTPSRIFVDGDVVTYEGKKYRAMWWTRNQTPTTVFGPWQEIVPPGTIAAFNPNTIYYGGETVTYNGRTYTAQWWTRLVPPGTPWSSWSWWPESTSLASAERLLPDRDVRRALTGEG